jgi:hypothetical protein
MYDDASSFTQQQFDKLDMNLVRSTLSNYATNRIFLVTECNLNNSALDKVLCRQNLDIGTVGTQSDSNTFLENVTIDNYLTFTNINLDNISDSSSSSFIILKCIDLDGNTQLSNIHHATETNFGFVKYDYDFTNTTESNSVVPWNVLRDFESNLKNDLDELVASQPTTDFNTYSNDVGTFLDRNLSQLSTIDNLTDLYDGLELSTVSYTGNYLDMERPVSIIAFHNDIELLSRYKNCLGLNSESALENLRCSNVAQQNHNNVDFEDGSCSLRNVGLKNGLTLYTNDDETEENKWLQINSNNDVSFSDIPIASKTEYGFVQKYDRYDLAKDDATVTINAFKNMFEYLNNKINTLDQEIHEFITGETITTVYDPITQNTTITVTQADGSSVATVRNSLGQIIQTIERSVTSSSGEYTITVNTINVSTVISTYNSIGNVKKGGNNNTQHIGK